VSHPRLRGAVALVAAVAVAHVVTERVPVVEQGVSDPFVRAGALGHRVHLSYADVEVTDVRPAQYLGSEISTDLARLAGGVWILVSVDLSATRKPELIENAWLVDPEGRRYVSSKRSQCEQTLEIATGVTTHALYCFDVPPDRLAGLHVRVARGDVAVDQTSSDDLADVDLGLSEKDVADWPDTTAAYLAYTSTLEPAELHEITLTQADS
jgi:hypothetical protein